MYYYYYYIIYFIIIIIIIISYSIGDMHMKDYMDNVSNQENVAPVYFQSLSLDY